jgi:hypothetical protein
MKELHHYIVMVAYASASATVLLVFVTRFLWRRKKPLQEP